MAVFGYAVHIHVFGWNSGKGSLASKHAELLRYVDTLPDGELCVIGVSAGGTAAINLLAQRPRTRKVVTVASPLQPKDRPTNPLLMASIDEVQTVFDRVDDDFNRKLLSVHGFFDGKVPVNKSQRGGVRSVRLPVVAHWLTILATLTVFASVVRGFVNADEPVPNTPNRPKLAWGRARSSTESRRRTTGR